MPEITTAIVLKSFETGNTSEVVHVFSSEYGRLSVYARGLRTAKNRFRGILQPLSLVQLTLYLKEGAEMATLGDAYLVDDHGAIIGDFERLTAGLLLAEAAAESCDRQQPAQEPFSLLVEALRHLDPRSEFPATSAACLGFLLILESAGYAPQIAEALLAPWPAGQPRPVCFWLDVESALITVEGPARPGTIIWPMPVPEFARQFPLPPSALRFHYEQEQGRRPAPLPEPEAVQFLEALIRLFEHHHERQLKGAGFWRRTIGG